MSSEELVTTELEHVIVVPGTEPTHDSDPDRGTSADHYIAAFIILLTIFGTSGNLLFFSYFWKRHKRTIYDLLYSVISILDALTSATSFPVIASLLNSRASMIFGNTVICHSWPVFFYFFIRMSMLLVVFLSVSRAIAIVKPFNFDDIQSQTKKLIVGIISYSLLLLTIDLVFLLTGSGLVGDGIKYIKRAAFCEIFVDIDQGKEGYNLESGWETLLYQALLQLEFIVPCLVVLISFLVSSIVLFRMRKSMNGAEEKMFRKVSITVALFTALFLLCYLPCFVLQLMNFVSLFSVRTPSFLTHNGAFLQYDYLLIQFVLPLFNAAINPVLYFVRMPQYRRWICETVGLTNSGGMGAARRIEERRLTEIATPL